MPTFSTDAQIDGRWFNRGSDDATVADALTFGTELKALYELHRSTIYRTATATTRNSDFADAPIGAMVMVEANSIIYEKTAVGSVNSSWTARKKVIPATGATNADIADNAIGESELIKNAVYALTASNFPPSVSAFTTDPINTRRINGANIYRKTSNTQNTWTHEYKLLKALGAEPTLLWSSGVTSAGATYGTPVARMAYGSNTVDVGSNWNQYWQYIFCFHSGDDDRVNPFYVFPDLSPNTDRRYLFSEAKNGTGCTLRLVSNGQIQNIGVFGDFGGNIFNFYLSRIYGQFQR